MLFSIRKLTRPRNVSVNTTSVLYGVYGGSGVLLSTDPLDTSNCGISIGSNTTYENTQYLVCDHILQYNKKGDEIYVEVFYTQYNGVYIPFYLRIKGKSVLKIHQPVAFSIPSHISYLMENVLNIENKDSVFNHIELTDAVDYLDLDKCFLGLNTLTPHFFSPRELALLVEGINFTPDNLKYIKECLVIQSDFIKFNNAIHHLITTELPSTIVNSYMSDKRELTQVKDLDQYGCDTIYKNPKELISILDTIQQLSLSNIHIELNVENGKIKTLKPLVVFSKYYTIKENLVLNDEMNLTIIGNVAKRVYGVCCMYNSLTDDETYPYPYIFKFRKDRNEEIIAIIEIPSLNINELYYLDIPSLILSGIDLTNCVIHM